MSPTSRTLTIAIIAFSPFAATTPLALGDKFEWQPASCVATVTTTVTALTPYSAISSAIQISLTNAASTSIHNDCQHDNCLRQFIRHQQATGFCATYTTNVNTATAGLPDYVSHCHAEPSRISSACSCIVTDVSPASSMATQATQTNDGTYTSAPTYPPASAQTSTYTVPDVCPASSIYFETRTTTLTFVSTITLDQESTIAAGITTSFGGDLTTTFTSSGLSEAVSSTVREHRQRHGGRSSA